MRGIYRIYRGDELVHEGENLITTNGKVAIQRYLAGITGQFGRSFRLGIFNTAAATSDTALACEVFATPVYLVSPDYTNTLLVYKGRIDESVAMAIYEIGLSTTMPDVGAQAGSRILLNFESSTESWVGVPANQSWQTSGVRYGNDFLRAIALTSASITVTLSDLAMDLSAHSDADEIKLAYSVQNSFVQSVQLRLLTDASNYYTYTITTPTTGFKVQALNKSSFTATGTPNWANITSAAVIVTSTAGGNASVDFEVLRIDDKDTFTETDILVSRFVPASPITKVVGQPLDIEYTVDLTL